MHAHARPACKRSRAGSAWKEMSFLDGHVRWISSQYVKGLQVEESVLRYSP